MRHKKYTERVDVWLTPEWKARVEAVANHPKILEPNAVVVRDALMEQLPHFERGLGIIPEGEDGPVETGGARQLDEDEKQSLVPQPGMSTGWGPDRG